MINSSSESKKIDAAKWRIVFLTAALIFLMTPLIAMQFTSEVNWTASDFVAAAALLAVVGVGLECATRLVRSRTASVSLMLLIVAGAALVWAEGAVGIFS